jgi:beta-lactamase superfamily II metal-dependent hydrolase
VLLKKNENMINSGYEIDFIPVDSGKKNGDAITIRITDNGVTKIYVIDGGTKASGQNLVNHIKEHYNTNVVDYLINTHPDLDHVSGMTVVMEQLEVKELWMHKPWEHANEIIDDILDNRVTVNSLTNRLQDSLKIAKQLEQMAIEREIPIYEPFQGDKIGHFYVLSPHADWYNELLKGFNNIPATTKLTFVSEAVKTFSDTVKTIFENWNIETLTEDGSTSDKNESSVVLFGQLPNDFKMLLTGDAGLKSLNLAYDYALNNNVDLKICEFIQMPHHGGRRNVSPTLLDKLIGPKLPEGTKSTKIAYVNTSKDCPEHPKKSVSNAFKRRGAAVIATNGQSKCNRWGYPTRADWVNVTPIPFYNQVEK